MEPISDAVRNQCAAVLAGLRGQIARLGQDNPESRAYLLQRLQQLVDEEREVDRTQLKIEPPWPTNTKVTGIPNR